MSSGLLTAYLISRYEYVNECFYPYLDYHNIEIFANKGFYAVIIQERISHRTLVIANTHMQSDTELEFIVGRKVTHEVRKAQHLSLIHI